MSYGEVHQFLLRSIASRGVVTILEAEDLLKSFTEESNHSIKDLVKDINNELKIFKQTIKITNDELTNEEVLVFISLGFDDATKAQNIFTGIELEYYRLLIEEIMSTEMRQITGMHAINLVSKMKGSFTKSDAQKLLKTWCRMYYLEKMEGNYALGLRAIHEFESYLRQNMPGAIEECCLCKQVVFRGCNCPGCALAVHTRCLNRYLEKINKWPCCKIDYDPEQLARLNRESSRLSQRNTTNTLDATEGNNTTTYTEQVEVTQETMDEDVDLTQGTAVGISQSVTRKRKRQRE